MDGFFAALVFLAGAYMLSAAIRLKREGVINKNLMRTPGNAMRPITDMEGFASYLYPKLMRAAIVTLITSIWFMVESACKVLLPPLVYSFLWLAIAVVFLICMWKYVQVVKKAEETYCRK